MVPSACRCRLRSRRRLCAAPQPDGLVVALGLVSAARFNLGLSACVACLLRPVRGQRPPGLCVSCSVLISRTAPHPCSPSPHDLLATNPNPTIERRYITPSSWMSYALIANQLGGNTVLVADDFRAGELVRHAL